MMLKSLIWDNPVLVKHLRSRLRLQHLIPLMAVVVVIAACIIWYGFSPREYGREEAIQTSLTMLLILQGLILFLGGSAQLAGTVVNAREQGMLDFHRMSPQRPVALALGFLLGAPIREYILFACTLPFIVPFIRLGQHGTLGMFGILLETIVVSLLYNVLALVLGLVNPKPRGSVAIVIIIVVALQLIHVVPGVAYLTIFPTAFSSLNFTQQNFTAALFGYPTAPMIVSLLNQIVLASFLFYVAVRKIRHERAYAYARPVAILFYLVIGVMVMADVMEPIVHPRGLDGIYEQNFAIPIEALPLVIISTMLLIGLFLLPAVTPKASDFIKGIRHARKQGLSLVPPWSDLAANWPPVLACGTLLLLLSSVACLLVQMRMHSLIGIDLHITRNSYLACVLATFTLIAYGLAKQAFDLLFRKNGMNYFALSLFALWVVPLFVLMMCGITEAAPKTIEAVAGISPFSGIAITATVGQDGISNVGRNIAFIVTGGVTIISVILYTFAVRRAQERAISVQQPVSKVPAQV